MLTYRHATEADMLLYFRWANDESVRQNAINKSMIRFEDHVKWFATRIADPDSIMLIFSEGNNTLGQLRIEIKNEEQEAVIDYSVDKDSRGKGLGTLILSEGYQYYCKLGKKMPMVGFVKVANMASRSAFMKDGYIQKDAVVLIEGEKYIKFSKDV